MKSLGISKNGLRRIAQAMGVDPTNEKWDAFINFLVEGGLDLDEANEYAKVGRDYDHFEFKGEEWKVIPAEEMGIDLFSVLDGKLFILEKTM